MFPLVSEAIGAVLPIERLRYLGLSHFEADECGALNALLAAAPQAVPICGQIAAMVVDNGLRGPRAARAGRWRGTLARPPQRSAGSTRHTCRTGGNAGS